MSKNTSREPRIHSHIDDLLPANHPLAHEDVRCDRCNRFLHASNNECMQTWVETGRGNFCWLCASQQLSRVLQEEAITPYVCDR